MALAQAQEDTATGNEKNDGSATSHEESIKAERTSATEGEEASSGLGRVAEPPEDIEATGTNQSKSSSGMSGGWVAVLAGASVCAAGFAIVSLSPK